jgi:Tfp pilus assembly protein PilF
MRRSWLRAVAAGGILAALGMAGVGMAAPAMGETSDAVASSRLVQPDPDGLSRRLAQAHAAESAGDLQAAGEIYRSTVAEHPDDAVIWSTYGEFLRFLVHDSTAARHAFLQALRVAHPSHQERALALKGLGDIAFACGDAQGAMVLMRQSLAFYPLAETHRALGVVLLVARHDVPAAAEQARQAVDLAPDEPLSLLVYAILCERLGHHDDGRAACTRALAIAGCDEQGRAAHWVHCCVFYNAACYLSVCGRRAAALTMLGAFFHAPNHLHRSRQDIETDPDFSGLNHDPAFIALLDRNLPRQLGDTLRTSSPCPSCVSAPPQVTR